MFRVDLLIDANTRHGLKPPVTGVYAEAIVALNQSIAPVIAVDIPREPTPTPKSRTPA